MTMAEWADNEIKLFKERASDEDKSEEHRGTVNVTYYDYLITPEGKRIELNIKMDEREERE